MFYLKNYAISITLSTVILVLCMMSPSDFPDAPMSNFDKIVHWIMFMGLSGTVFFDGTDYFRKKISNLHLFWGSFVFPIVFSGLIEILQEYVTPFRTGDWGDFLFDVIGAFCGLVICWRINKRLTSPVQ